MQYSTVVDRHRFDADPDTNFHCVVDPDPDQHQNDADPHPTTTRFKPMNLADFFPKPNS
jgi:hypothetical protein